MWSCGLWSHSGCSEVQENKLVACHQSEEKSHNLDHRLAGCYILTFHLRVCLDGVAAGQTLRPPFVRWNVHHCICVPSHLQTCPAFTSCSDCLFKHAFINFIERSAGVWRNAKQVHHHRSLCFLNEFSSVLWCYQHPWGPSSVQCINLWWVLNLELSGDHWKPWYALLPGDVHAMFSVLFLLSTDESAKVTVTTRMQFLYQ